MRTSPTGIRAESSPERIALYRAAHLAPLLVQNAAPDRRPYLHPVIAPDGHGVLTEDSPPHHRWQHGLYVGLNDVNGIGFWTEQLAKVKEHDGTFHPQPLVPAITAGSMASWSVHTEWRHPDGAPMLMETQSWRFVDGGASYMLDLTWMLHAAIDLTFGQYAYGGVFLRMPYREERGGTVRNSAGQEGAAAEGQRARWVAVSMVVDGRADLAGIALLDHPRNAEHPVPWRVDRQLGISPSRCIAGPWSLPAGQRSVSHYRVLVFTGAIDSPWIDRQWEAFAAGEPGAGEGQRDQQ